MTVAVVDDHELVVRGAAAMLQPFREQVEMVEFTAEEQGGPHVDVVLYGACIRSGLDGADLDRLVHHRQVGRVVLYTWHLTEEPLGRAQRHGVHAALPKSLDAERLASALMFIREGRLDAVSALPAPGPSGDPWPGRAAGLTARESEIIALVTAGLSNNEIAERTYLSINSVKSYVRTAYHTMGVTSRTCAVLWGIDHGMAPERMRILSPAS